MLVATMTKYINWDEVPIVLTTKEVSEILGVHINTVKNLISRNELRSFKVGRMVKVNKVDLKKYVGLVNGED